MTESQLKTLPDGEIKAMALIVLFLAGEAIALNALRISKPKTECTTAEWHPDAKTAARQACRDAKKSKSKPAEQRMFWDTKIELTTRSQS